MHLCLCSLLAALHSLSAAAIASSFPLANAAANAASASPKASVAPCSRASSMSCCACFSFSFKSATACCLCFLQILLCICQCLLYYLLSCQCRAITSYAGVFTYYISKLSNDMTSLAETPRLVSFTNHVYGPCGDGKTDDKPFIHKMDETYYLSWGCFYATSSSIYGPFTMQVISYFCSQCLLVLLTVHCACDCFTVAVAVLHCLVLAHHLCFCLLLFLSLSHCVCRVL